jgi:hypothetical protein
LGRIRVEELTRTVLSMAAKSGSGDSTSAGWRGGGLRRWSGQRALGHHDGARGHAGVIRRWPEQSVCVEALGDGGVEGNRHQWCCTAAIGIRGWVREVAGARTGPRSIGRPVRGWSRLVGGGTHGGHGDDFSWHCCCTRC